MQDPIKRLNSRIHFDGVSGVPSKSHVAKLAGALFGAANVARVLECAPGFDYKSQAVLSESEDAPYNAAKIVSQYSSDHFDFGALDECKLQITRERIQILLHQLFEKDGGIIQCPEVGAVLSTLASGAPEKNVFCEVGFNVGASATSFSQGLSNKVSCELHSFDLNFPKNIARFLDSIYGHRVHFVTHEGELTQTLRAFYERGNRCDVIFLDAKHPDDMKETLKLARNKQSLFIYHWHFRNQQAKPYLLDALKSTLNEVACFKTLCSLTHHLTGETIVRESCIGKLDFGETKTWWENILL